MTTEVASLKTIFTADTSGLIRGTNEARNALSDATATMGSKLQDLGGKISGLGQSWTIATAPITAALGISVKKFASFEAAMANAHSITGATGDAAAALNDQILAIGSSSRQSNLAVAEGYYQIVSGVADASSHIAILNTGLAVSEAGASELDGTLGALIGSMNAYGASANDAATFGDIMTATVQSGVLTMDELAAALPNVTSQAAAMGIPFEEVGAAMARMTQVGNSASVSSTQMRQAMVALLTPSANLEKIYKDIGVASGQALVDQEGFIGALEMVNTAADAAGLGINEVFTSVEAANAAMILGTDAAKQFADSFVGINAAATPLTDGKFSLDFGEGEMPDMGGFDGATEAAQAIQADTLTADIELLNSSLDGLAIKVGEVLAPALRDIATTLTPIVGDIADWAEQNPGLASSIVAIASGVVVLGPALWLLGSAITAVGGAVGLLSGAFAILTAPITLVIGAGIALGVMFYKLMTEAGGLAQLLQNSLTTAFQLAVIPIGLVALGLKKVWDWVTDLISGIPGIDGLFDAAFSGVEAIIGGVGGAIEGVAGFVSELAGKLQDLLDLAGQAGSLTGVTSGSAPRYSGNSVMAAAQAQFGGGNNSGQPRADGGPVSAGTTYMVGERGPEMFVPARSGTIIPNDVLASGGGRSGNTMFVLQNPTFNGITDIQTFLDQLEREAARRS